MRSSFCIYTLSAKKKRRIKLTVPFLIGFNTRFYVFVHSSKFESFAFNTILNRNVQICFFVIKAKCKFCISFLIKELVQKVSAIHLEFAFLLFGKIVDLKETSGKNPKKKPKWQKPLFSFKGF